MSLTPAIITLVQTLGNQGLDTGKALKEFNTEQHAIFDRSLRKKRKKIVPTGVTKVVDGKEVDVTKVTFEEVNRIALPLQKLIVSRRVAFMNCGEMKIIAKPEGPIEERLLEMVKRCWTDNKMDFNLQDIAERQMSELIAAVLWYSEDVDKGYWGKLSPNAIKAVRMQILSPQLGDTLLPVFDGGGKLTYFARGYKAKKDLVKLIDFNNPNSVDAVPFTDDDIEHLDIYNDEMILLFQREKGVWVLMNSIKHTYGKMPVGVFQQPGGKPEWNDVQPVIERIETVISNVGEIVDANAFPILFAQGVIKSMPAKGEAGRVINVVPQVNNKGEEIGKADLRYITWDSAPEAIKLEIDTLVNFVYTCSQTPDISTSGMAELAITSGAGYDRVFTDAHLAAKKHTQGAFGKSVQRCINFLISACIAIDNSLKPAANLQISIEFPLFRINDTTETVNMLIAATGGQTILSQRTAVGMSGLVLDAEKEYDQIQEEQDTLGKEMDAQPKAVE